MYLISQDGWEIGSKVRELVPTKNDKGKFVYKEVHDFEFKKVRYKADLIPPVLIIGTYFQTEQLVIDELQSTLDMASSELENYVEENSGEEGVLENVSKKAEAQYLITEFFELAANSYFAELYIQYLTLQDTLATLNSDFEAINKQYVLNSVKNEKGNVTKKAVETKVKELDTDSTEYETLTSWLDTSKKLTATKKKIKELRESIENELAILTETQPQSEYILELSILNQYLFLLEEESKASKEVKEAKDKLDAEVFKKYPTLSIMSPRKIINFKNIYILKW